jgi:hypothetical protein
VALSPPQRPDHCTPASVAAPTRPRRCACHHSHCRPVPTTQVCYACHELPPGPNLVQNQARRAKFGQLRRTSAAGTEFRRPSAASSLALGASRPTRSGRPGLDCSWFRSEPRDHDPTDEICAYRFGLILPRAVGSEADEPD